ncbi:hypothetical protein HPB50_006659 [Hyalomma asiaticum]|uniref:Uncharacterized protein n=1 Tax=Hyalomma asiaticum TaxID=266040 RepID=A0ACB7SVR1_HYAAI|nr:hypothetical protein HPB50_006659 [Hyalomma asiaticum]
MYAVFPLPACIRKQLRWKVTSITPLLIRQTVVRSGFRLTRDGPYWNGTWGKHIKCFTFAEIKGFQKVNHFPGSFHLGRKDKLWQNVVRLGRIRGEKGRPSLPDTFLLPHELPLLKDAWVAGTPGDQCWIIKPPASARGSGVHVVHRWDQIPKKQPLVVQRYVRNPYLINGTKFDLRLYALVTSFDPLKIYLYPDGLVRFASIKYSQESEDLSDRYMHLTNYSINKKSATYTPGGSGDCQGHKWSIKALQGYLEGLGVDFTSLWEQMVDIVVKTLACAEGPMNRLIQRHTSSRYTCYELFGFDILLDDQLKPWLLEVNISPSLRSATPVDYTVKSEVVKDMFNLVGFQLPQQLKDDLDERLLECYGLEEHDDLSLNPLLHTYSLSPAELLKHRHYETSLLDVEEETSGLLDSLTPDDVRVLVQSEDELSRCGSFERVFPGGRHGDVTLLAHRRYYNLLLAAWERRYGHQRHKGGFLRLTSDATFTALPSSSASGDGAAVMSPKCASAKASRASLLAYCKMAVTVAGSVLAVCVVAAGIVAMVQLLALGDVMGEDPSFVPSQPLIRGHFPEGPVRQAGGGVTATTVTVIRSASKGADQGASPTSAAPTTGREMPP